MRAVIFAGPSLPPSARPVDPRIDWRPPVRQGELYRAALARPAVIGIVDGYFEVTPTVWHKEILWAMTQGIHVFGAASIGALRAAELEPFGMCGIGRIYQDFRDGVLEDDDEIAVLHGPKELGYPSVTEAMVNIRATIEQAAREGIVTAAMSAALMAIAKALFYKERTYQIVLKTAAASGLDAAELTRFEQWLSNGRVDQKRNDALMMLQAVSEHISGLSPPLRVFYELAETAAWAAARRRAEVNLLSSP
jgi:hypothetical protein